MLHRPHQAVLDGTLCITGHHLIVSAHGDEPQELWLLHSNVDCVERRQQGMTGGTLWLKCKDLRILQLDIIGADQFNKVANTLEDLIRVDPQLQYPFFYRAMYPVLEDGWSTFLPESEFSRLVQPGDDWRISYVNKDYKVCASYPSAVVVPRNMEDSELVAIASFRQSGRFPVLAYRHQANAVLMRSGQPLITANGRRCKEDERLLNSVLAREKRGYIIDTRTQNLAQSAKLRGGGYEPELHYPNWRRVHKPIDRHHVHLDSLTKLMDGVNDTSSGTDKWLSRLEGSNWMNNIKETLNCACLVAQCLDQEGASVLVHDTEGLDSTLQVTSLAQIILNPDCRTVRGLEDRSPFYTHLEDSLNPDIQTTLLYLVRYATPVSGILPISAYTHNCKWKVLVDIAWGTFNNEELFEWPDCNVHPQGLLPNVAVLVVFSYLESLPTPLLYPEDGWHTLGHKLLDINPKPLPDSYPGFFIEEMEELRKELPDGKRLLLDQIIVSIAVTARATGEFDYNGCLQREWIQAGHPFATRHARSCYTPSTQRSPRAHSPTFLLFLDCVHQIHSQFSCSFEFAESFLVMLFHHSYSSQFGTFLGNNEGERRALGCHDRTTSLWSYVNRPEVLPSYLNPMYEPNQRVIWPSVAPMSLQLWSAVYLAWVVEQGAVEAAWGVARELRERDASLRSKVARLRRQLQDLEREALDAGILAVPSPTEVEVAN
ncbi:hypothetical protein Pmani_032600 [Petrolisthes manimaculis]|uniref:Myotubularin phosphatase domain-containing protein n=1 Tax=Petrolisthes manimaculis TaxID=1843537 RepID=A0AAE1NTI4_9EUCA|nr:hypothetical protein Pmani_032600 [Petrolisthes manimaculis]